MFCFFVGTPKYPLRILYHASWCSDIWVVHPRRDVWRMQSRWSVFIPSSTRDRMQTICWQRNTRPHGVQSCATLRGQYNIEKNLWNMYCLILERKFEYLFLFIYFFQPREDEPCIPPGLKTPSPHVPNPTLDDLVRVHHWKEYNFGNDFDMFHHSKRKPCTIVGWSSRWSTRWSRTNREAASEATKEGVKIYPDTETTSIEWYDTRNKSASCKS